MDNDPQIEDANWDVRVIREDDAPSFVSVTFPFKLNGLQLDAEGAVTLAHLLVDAAIEVARTENPPDMPGIESPDLDAGG